MARRPALPALGTRMRRAGTNVRLVTTRRGVALARALGRPVTVFESCATVAPWSSPAFVDTDHARPGRARRAAPHPRAHAYHQPARGTDRRPRRAGRAAAALRARLRSPDRRQARRRSRGRRPLRKRRAASDCRRTNCRVGSRRRSPSTTPSTSRSPASSASMLVGNLPASGRTLATSRPSVLLSLTRSSSLASAVPRSTRDR